jgi:hypothetical protein
MSQKVIFTEVFGDHSRLFLQAVYDTAFDWLADQGSILVDEHHSVEKSGSEDTYRAKSELSHQVKITPTLCRHTDGDYTLRVHLAFTYQYYDITDAAAEELAQLARYDYDHRFDDRTLSEDLLSSFDEKIPRNQPFAECLVEPGKVWVVPEFDTSEHDPKYSVGFEFGFKITTTGPR